MKKIVALLLTAVMVLGCMPGLAENTKHERVYVVATADGTIKSITDSVRLENADGLDEIMDQTILSDIQNVGGKETFTLDEKTLTWKANGKDIVYQGTSDKTPVLLPVVTLTLDGADASFADLKNKTGDAVLTVTYQQQAALPILAVTVLPLPQEGITDLKLENAAILSEMGRQALVGWAVPGAAEKLNLPASFTVSFHADHADLNWMLTFSSADPVDTVCRELNERIDLDIHTEMDEVKLLLKAVQNGEALPETTGKTKDIVPKVNELNDGLAQLNDGAASLADGASQLSSGASELKDGAATLADGAVTLAAGAANAEAGAATLDEGLAALTANNEALNTGAEALFAAVLDTANQQLAAAGLDAAGITLPELTAENYAAALDGVLAQLDPAALKEAAAAQVEAVVRPQVEANAEQVRSAVEAAAQQKILEAVLQAAGQEMTAEQYTQAVKAGMVSAEQAAMVSATVEQQMASDEVKAQIEENVLAQIEQLVQQNVESYLASDETVAAKLAMAQTAYDSLSALKAQLDQVNTFVKGLEAYTAGTAQAAAGASQLHTGLTQLSTGAASLSTGASTLSTGASTLADGASQLSTGAGTLKDGMQTMKDTIVGAEKEAANKLLPYVENELADALRIFEETRDSVQNSGYDLRPEGMNAITVYIIRTDLK
jgi:putative membrane protein